MPGRNYMREVDADCRRFAIVFGTCAIVVVSAVMFTALAIFKEPHYSATIDSASGLDGGNSTTLTEPLFNVTLRVTTRGLLRHDCVAPGSIVEVSYAGVPLAAGRARRSCAMHGTSEGQVVVAWGANVCVPQFAVDGLAADKRRGAQTFDVAVWMPSTHKNARETMLVLCTGLRAGDAAASLSPCAVSYVDAAMPVSSDVHRGGQS